jgi:membrane protein implicated in regulation of membrane protease activity
VGFRRSPDRVRKSVASSIAPVLSVLLLCAVLYFLVAPIVVSCVFGPSMVFEPHVFMTEWFKALGTLLVAFTAFYWANIVWGRRMRSEEQKRTRERLGNTVGRLISLVDAISGGMSGDQLRETRSMVNWLAADLEGFRTRVEAGRDLRMQAAIGELPNILFKLHRLAMHDYPDKAALSSDAMVVKEGVEAWWKAILGE